MKEFKGNTTYKMMGALVCLMVGMAELPFLMILSDRFEDGIIPSLIILIVAVLIYIILILTIFGALSLLYPTKIIVEGGKIRFCSLFNRLGVEIERGNIVRIKRTKGYGDFLFNITYVKDGRVGYKLMDTIYYGNDKEFDRYFNDLYLMTMTKNN